MYLLDSNAVIDFCNAKLPDNAKNLLQNNQPQISVITRIELFGSSKTSDEERIKLEQFVQIATVYDRINPAIIDHTIRIRQVHKTDLPDAIIAATALAYRLILISRNISDFKNIEGLQVIDPYNL
jgi:predicted nucleic acid-binding protein